MKTRAPAKKSSGPRLTPAAGDAEVDARRAQVQERKAQGGMSLFDEAMAVAEDVARFGFQRTVAIWDQSEGWVSKRAHVVKYDKAVLSLLQQGLCTDLEALHSLNQLQGLDQRSFDAFAARLRDGKPVSRAAVRSRVAAAKDWTRPGNVRDGALGAGAETFDQSPGSERALAERVLMRKRSELMEWGVANGLQIDDLGRTVQGLNLDLAEGEWVFWSGFLDAMLPMVRALGSERARAYLRRSYEELAHRDAATWWAELHPKLDGQGVDASTAARAPVAKMPDGWGF